MIFKFKYMVRGGHTHYKIWTGKTEHALGSNGPRLTMTNEEWTVFTTIIDKGLIPDSNVIEPQEHQVIWDEQLEGEGWLW